MSASSTILDARFRQPHPFFDRLPGWLRPAGDGALTRWAHVSNSKPFEFALFVGVPVLLLLSALVILVALPFVLLSGAATVADLQALVQFDGARDWPELLIGSAAYEFAGGYVVAVLWSIGMWLSSRRSIALGLVVAVAVLVLQALHPDHSLVMAYGLAMGWVLDELFGIQLRHARAVVVAVALAGAGVHAGVQLGLGQGLGRSAGVLALEMMMLSSTWYYFTEWSSKRLLDTSQTALRAQASAAERERIGRDLHDLLGHTLSLITLKLELSRKLAESDPQRSRAEANDAEDVARQALAQVRAAVTGMRATDLHGEMASAGLLLESRGVAWSTHAPPPLPQGIDTMLSLVLREAVTNIARHADATTARLQFLIAGDVVQMIITDDGRGIGSRRGNGLTGMRERVEALDGVLSIDGSKGMGTQLTISVPLTVAQELTA